MKVNKHSVGFENRDELMKYMVEELSSKREVPVVIYVVGQSRESFIEEEGLSDITREIKTRSNEKGETLKIFKTKTTSFILDAEETESVPRGLNLLNDVSNVLEEENGYEVKDLLANADICAIETTETSQLTLHTFSVRKDPISHREHDRYFSKFLKLYYRDFNMHAEVDRQLTRAEIPMDEMFIEVMDYNLEYFNDLCEFGFNPEHISLVKYKRMFRGV